jgi:hypothetical protein
VRKVDDVVMSIFNNVIEVKKIMHVFCRHIVFSSYYWPTCMHCRKEKILSATPRCLLLPPL